MANLLKVSKGQRFRPRADEWNAFVDAARYVKDRAVNQQADANDLADDASPFRNASPSDMPQYGLGWLTDAAFQGLAVVKQPAYPGISRIIVASKPSVAGELGAGWTEGLRPVRVSNWADVSVGDRIGAQKDSWDACADQLGPMLVIGKLVEPLVVALLTGQRGDHVMVRNADGDVALPAQNIRFGDEWQLTLEQPGVALAKLVETP